MLIMRRLCTVLLPFLTITVTPSYAESLSTISSLPSLKGAQVGLYVADADSGEMIVAHNAKHWMQPASTQKILTSLVARKVLGEQFRFTTSVHADVQGALINFVGDPTFTHQQLGKLLSVAYQGDPSLFSGDIRLNQSEFVGRDRAIGVTWDNLGVCYAAPASGFAIDKNCVPGALYGNQAISKPTRLNVAPQHAITTENHVEIVSKSTHLTSRCELHLDAYPSNHYVLTGCLVQRKEPLPLNFAVQDPASYLTSVVRQALTQQGIPFNGTITVSNTSLPRSALSTAIAEHHSAPLSELLDELMLTSNNILTDSLLRHIGAHHGQGSFENGTFIVKQYLASWLDDESWLDVPMEDGSGLSRNSRLTAEHLAQVLAHLHRNNDPLLTYFPIAGETGTMAYRRSLRGEPFKANVKAKTGSLYGARNLAGYLTTQSGRTLLFVQLINDNFTPTPKGKSRPIDSFEKALYHKLITEY